MEQIIDMRTTTKYLGVPIIDPSQRFSDNKSVVSNSIPSHTKLHKQHNSLSFHQVRESIAAGIFRFYHVRSEDNPTAILNQH